MARCGRFHFSIARSAIAIIACCFSVTSVSAQPLTISSPAIGSNSVAACADYASDVLRDPWDFTQSTDVPTSIKPLQYANLTEPLSFSGGVMSFKSSSNDPYFSLITPQVDGSIALPESVRYGVNSPIDTSKYDTLSVRMYTDQSSFMQVYWSNKGVYAISDPVTTYAGEWRTYTINLATAGVNAHGNGAYQWTASSKEQLRLDLSAVSGANVLVDWVQLTKSEASCPQVGVQFQSQANSLVALYVDDDTTVSNGNLDHQVVKATGSAQTAQFSTAKVPSNSYTVYGYKSDDYATLLGDPWDMNNSADIDATRIYNLSNARFEGGKFCATTTNSDGNFYMALPLHKPVDTSLFKYLTVKLEVAVPDRPKVTVSNVQFFDKDQQIKGAINDLGYDTVNETIEFDLSGSGGWVGDMYFLRIQPTTTSGVSFCIPWISLTASAPVSYVEPAIPTLVTAPTQVTIGPVPTVNFVQPDNRGGQDCPTHDLGHPWTMSSQADIQGLANITNAEFRPYNQVVDSRGLVRTGDFLRGKSVVGNDDPKVLLLNFSKSLNADRCTHLCYSLILNRTYEQYQSVARMTYLSSAGQPENGDDIINPDRWSDSDVCVYLKELQQEPLVAPGTEHPWKGNISFMSLDPHEDRDGNEFFVDYVEVREDHKANTQFALVVDAATDKAVELYYSTAKPTSSSSIPSGATLVATLGAGRSSNVYRWDTSGLSAARYYIAARVDPNGNSPVVANAPLPVVVDHSFTQDTTIPYILLDSPTDGRKVTSTLQVAGATFDDVRLATNELFIDDVYRQAVQPTIYHKGAREQYGSIAPDKPGFNIFIDVSALSSGSHTYRLVSYDTAGNSNTMGGTFVKGATADADVTYPDANAAAVPFTTAANTLMVQVADGKNLEFAASGYEGCTSTAILASSSSDMSGAVTLFNGSGSLIKTALDIPRWVATSSSAFMTLAAKKPVKKCRMVKVCTKKKGRRVCRMVKKCSVPKPKPTPVPTATPTPGSNPGLPPTTAPPAEDGIVYFQAACSGTSKSNPVAINFGTQNTNSSQTTFETVILQQLQAKLSS